MKKRSAVILAAGQGTRMKSKLYKVLHPILGRPMIQYVIDALKPISVGPLVTVVGHGAESVMREVGTASEFVVQEEQLGTAHAVLQAKERLAKKQGTTIVVCGDTPLITAETFERLFAHHEASQAKATILTTNISDPTGYGRIVRDDQANVKRIVEHKDATEAEKSIQEINTGTYCFDNEALFRVLEKVGNDNVQGEYYLPDVIEILKSGNEKVSAFIVEDQEETIGINDRVALSQSEKIMKRRINTRHLRNGVTITDIEQTYIAPEVTIEADVTIHPGTMISGNTHIGAGSVIGPHTEIDTCHIGEDTIIRQSVVNNSKIGNKVDIGPFAHIRPESEIHEHVKVGNFVEVKKSLIEEHTKVPHLSYIGDAILGKDVNIGCGAITVNYDGKDKHQTTVRDNSFIGCNVNMVAPVTIEEGSFVAAGSTVTKNVPKDSLAFGRARQVNKEGYVTKHMKK